MSEERSALEEYKALLTMRMLLYRLISLSLQSTSLEGASELYHMVSRLPRETPTIVSESLNMPSFAKYYQLLFSMLLEKQEKIVNEFKRVLEKGRKCDKRKYMQPIGDYGRKIAELAGLKIESGEKVSPEFLLELAYTILGMEYSALDEYNILSLVDLETSFVREELAPSLSLLGSCLASIDETLPSALGKLITDFAATEKSIADAQRKVVEQFSKKQS